MAGESYVDGVQIRTNPYGATLLLTVTVPPLSGSTEGAPTPVGVIRMGLPLLKELAFLITRQVRQHEERTATLIQVPTAVLNGDGIALEDWSHFWR